MDWLFIDQLNPDRKAQAAGLKELASELDRLTGSLDLVGLPGGAAAFVLAQAAVRNRRLLVITPNPGSAEALALDLKFFLGEDSPVRVSLFPPYDHLPFGQVEAHPWTVARRIRCLWLLSSSQEPVVAVAPVQSLLLRVMPRQVLTNFAELILEGEELDREGLIAKLVSGGYSPTALVEEPGDMAVRGGIVDVFGPHDDEPLRLEFFGDFVDSLRLFKPHDQRSVKRLKESVLLPMSEVVLDQASLDRGRHNLARLEADPAKILTLRQPLTQGQPFPGIESFLPLFYQTSHGLWDYLDQDGLVCLMDPAGVEKSGQEHLQNLKERQRRLAPSSKSAPWKCWSLAGGSISTAGRPRV
ncbi:MAG: hypothetical protein JRJ59_09730 [Deltaproteobacteria bacterium]|nr:hypothetical protein [Deltaproteobacteria bacterium]